MGGGTGSGNLTYQGYRELPDGRLESAGQSIDLTLLTLMDVERLYGDIKKEIKRRYTEEEKQFAARRLRLRQ